MSSETIPAEPGRASRRAVVRGAAWTVPVVVTVAAAPAFAASLIPCPVVPGSASWEKTTWRGTPSGQADSDGWSNNKWVIWKDNASTSSSLTFDTFSSRIPVTPGATYEGSFTFWWQYGNQTAAQSSRGTFSMYINGVQVAINGADSGQSLSTGVGSAKTIKTRTFSYKVPANTTNIAIFYRYEIAARSGSAQPVSDDIEVSIPTFGTCRN